jgi:5-methylcytosine-specific restriction enzyme subunit McrC
LGLRSLPEMLRQEMANTDRRLHEIDVVPLSRRTFRSVHLNRNNRFYRFLLQICRLVHDCMLVNEKTGEVQFRDFARDNHRMRALFERFLRNLYASSPEFVGQIWLWQGSEAMK